MLRYSASLNVSNSDYQSRLLMRSELRAAIERTLSENDLDGLCIQPSASYPSDLEIHRRVTRHRGQLHAVGELGLAGNLLSAGFTDDGLPVGIEILGSMLSDAELLAIADSYEKANPFVAHLRSRPPLCRVFCLRCSVG